MIHWNSARSRTKRILAAVAIAALWAWVVYIRAQSVHVINVRGADVGESYRVTCGIKNPTAHDARVIARVALLAERNDTEGHVPSEFAVTQRELFIPARSEEPLEVVFRRTWPSWRVVHPWVTLRAASPPALVAETDTPAR